MSAHDEIGLLARLVERYAIRFFAAVIVAVCVGALYWAPRLRTPWPGVVTSVAGSLLASLLFALLYGWLVERHHLRVVADEARGQLAETVGRATALYEQTSRQIMLDAMRGVRDLNHETYQLLLDRFPSLLPTDVFPHGQTPDARFNEIVRSALSAGARYYFKGATGRHVAARLRAVPDIRRECKVLLIDPTRADLLRLYSRLRFGRDESKSVKCETLMAIVDLFYVAQEQATVIEVALFDGPVHYRTEIFDDKILVSYFTSPQSTGYPESYLYAAGSRDYEVLSIDFRHAWELNTSRSVRFESGTGMETLAKFVESLGEPRAAIPGLHARATEFAREFNEQLGSSIRPAPGQAASVGD